MKRSASECSQCVIGLRRPQQCGTDACFVPEGRNAAFCPKQVAEQNAPGGADADVDMAVKIVLNAKVQRPSVCNAAETLLIDKKIADKFIPVMFKALKEKNVEIRGCDRTKQILGDCVVTATEEDYRVEFLDYIIAVKVVDSLDDAIAHIQKYSTGHSECIVTSDYNSANEFTARIDSAAVYVNASTRFTDGGEFGLGAEIGISTQKLHARGPMGLNELTSSKYIIRGNGQIR